MKIHSTTLIGMMLRPLFYSGMDRRWFDGSIYWRREKEGALVLRSFETKTCKLVQSIGEHSVSDAIAVARLIGISAPVHMSQIEPPNGAQRAGLPEQFSDRG